VDSLLFPVYGYNLITGSVILYSSQDLENFFKEYYRSNTLKNLHSHQLIYLGGCGTLKSEVIFYNENHTFYYWRFVDKEGDLVSLSPYYEQYYRKAYQLVYCSKQYKRPRKQSVLSANNRKIHLTQIKSHHEYVNDIMRDEEIPSFLIKKYSRVKYSIVKENQIRCKRLRMKTERNWKKHRKNQYHIL